MDTSRMCEQKVCLKSQAIAIAASNLENGLSSSFLDQETPAYRGEAHHRALVIGDVDGIHLVLEQIHVVDHV